MKLQQILRDWSLPIVMLAGVVMYLLYANIPFFRGYGHIASAIVSVLQPLLILAMLFVTFCKVRLKELKPSRWHLWLLAFQLLPFAVISLSITFFPTMPVTVKVLLEAAMMCLVCPTATAAAVITAKLGGNSASLISYTIQINIAVALAAPLFICF